MTSVLIIDDHPIVLQGLRRVLEDTGVKPVLEARDVTSGYRLFRRNRPDVIIVDISRPDRETLDDLRRVGADNPRPVVMFVDRDDRAFMEEAIAAGVNSYNVVDRAFPDVEPIVMAAVAIFRRYRQVAEDLHKANATLKERETINRAKSMLMKQRSIDEPKAYRWLRRRAMNGNRRIVDVAAELLAGAGEDEPGN